MSRATYYDRLKRNHKPDKYAQLKKVIKQIFKQSKQTYGYRRIHKQILKKNFTESPETIRRIMGDMNLQPTIYNKHTGRYNSYKGTIGKVAPNILKQHFNAQEPYTVLHTDVTQLNLMDGTKGYISAITDEASQEVLAVVISAHPDKKPINQTLKILKRKLPSDATPVLHSDQGCQYQVSSYRQKLIKMGITQSMSRKGNCHDNAPIESWFSLLKREWLNRMPLKNLWALKRATKKYQRWFNSERISMKHDGMTPVEYRSSCLAA